MKYLEIDNPEKLMYSWWSKIRWFIVIVLFAIGILRVNQIQQTYPTIIFIVTFLGISILNILYHLQILAPNTWVAALQIILDIVFATLVVHLTGGMDSHFVWIYLVAVITASLSIDKAGGFISAMIGSMSMLLLIMTYSYNWLEPVTGSNFSNDIPSQTIFLISYTALFSGIAFVSSYISTLLKQIAVRTNALKTELHNQAEKIAKSSEILESNNDSIIKYKEVIETAASIAGIDHDINNPLTIISLSIRRIKKAAAEYNDMKLIKASEQMTEAINSINGILVRLQKLKRLELIKEERNKQQGI